VYVVNPACVHGVPGLTVAFSHQAPFPAWQGFAASDGGRLDMRGTGPEPIRFASTLACGDMIGSRSCEAIPGRIWLFGGIAVSDSGTGDFEYCTMEHAFNGLSLGGPTQSVSGCRFDDCQYGIVHRSDSTCNRTIKNCLFRDSWVSAVHVNSTETLELLNCTVARADVGVVFTTGTHATVRNSIFADTSLGMWKYEDATVVEDHNCFAYGHVNFTTDTTDLGQNPKFDNTTAPDLYARFFLQQDSLCIDAGDTSVLVRRLADFTTRRTASADRGLVDMGYHYGPVCRGGGPVGNAGEDADADGLNDAWEIFFFGSTAARGGNEDDDGDGLTAAQEYLFKCNPLVYDIPVRAYRDSAYADPITDWDEWPGHYRQSPRFVFAHAATGSGSRFYPIYLEVIAPVSTSTIPIKVTCEADPTTAVYVTLTETSPGSHVFRSTGDPLYLSTQTLNLSGGGHLIKVVDEDTVSFSFVNIGAGVRRDVLVDRGEWAGCGIEPRYARLHQDRDQLVWGAWGQCHLSRSGDATFDGYIGGDPLNENGMAYWIRDAGEDSSDSLQADFLHICCHGADSGSGTLMDEGSLVVFKADLPDNGILVNYEWNRDVDWVLVHACKALSDWGEGYKTWRRGLCGNPRRAHGLLGGDGTLETGQGIDDFWHFLDPANVCGHRTFLQAYKDAKGGFNWAVYYRTDNAADKLDVVTPDNDEENPEYTYEDHEGHTFTEHGQWLGAGTTETLDEGRCLVKCDLDSLPGHGMTGRKSIMGRKAFPSLREDFPVGRNTRVLPWGNVTHTGSWDVAGRICPYTPDQAADFAKAFVQREMPSIAHRIRWLPPGRIRWGRHRENEPLVLQTGGYSVVGELCHGDVPILNDIVDVTILGEAVENLSVTCHEVIQAALAAASVMNCRAALEKALPEIKAALGLGESYAILNARLVYAGPLGANSPGAEEEYIEYHSMWELVVQTSADGCACHERAVYLDAETGAYVGHRQR
jgi:hypothetical protein